MALEFNYPPGATPLDPDEIAGLIPKGVTTVAELNAYEAENILDAMKWIEGQRPKPVLNDQFLRDLHRHMFNRTWRWSGTFRLTEKNIGVAPEAIAVSLAFSWGTTDLAKAGLVRERYIAALREADKRNYEPLLDFVRA